MFPRIARYVSTTFVLLVTLCLPAALLADDVSVSCGVDPLPAGHYATIQEAVNAVDDLGPHLITANGSCAENVTISFKNRLTISGPPTQMVVVDGGPVNTPPVNPVFRINRSTEITLRRLHIRNGAGVNVFASEVTIAASIVDGSGGGCVLVGPDSRLELSSSGINGVQTAVTLASCAGPGIDVARSQVIANGALIEGNGSNSPGPLRPGGVLANSATVQLSNVTVRNNTGTGVGSFNGSQVFLNGGVIENHPTYGVSAEHTSMVGLGGTIRNNGTAGALYGGGVSAIHNSTIRGGANIQNNIGPGILLDSGSTMFMGGITVTGNTDDGIRLVNRAILEVFVPPVPPLPPRTFSGNGGNDIACDNTALVFGDTLPGIKTNCSIKRK